MFGMGRAILGLRDEYMCKSKKNLSPKFWT